MATDIFEVLDDLRNKLNEVSVKLTQIQDAMFGNHEFGREGLIARLAEHERRLRHVERTRISLWQMVMTIVVLVVAALLVDGRAAIALSFPVALALASILIALLVVFLVAYNTFWRV